MKQRIDGWVKWLSVHSNQSTKILIGTIAILGILGSLAIVVLISNRPTQTVTYNPGDLLLGERYSFVIPQNWEFKDKNESNSHVSFTLDQGKEVEVAIESRPIQYSPAIALEEYANNELELLEQDPTYSTTNLETMTTADGGKVMVITYNVAEEEKNYEKRILMGYNAVYHLTLTVPTKYELDQFQNQVAQVVEDMAVF